MENKLSPDISVIIPFCERKGDRQCFKRLQNAVHCFSDKEGVEVIVYDTTPKPISPSIKTISEIPGVRYFHQPERTLFSPGRTRNLAVKKAIGQYLFFCDADLLCPEDLVDSLVLHAQKLKAQGEQAFAMFPCLYLSKIATNKILSGDSPDFSRYWRSYFLGELTEVDGIAVASSCLLLNRQWFQEVGEFKTEFSGHGCEDFELIHRLSAYYPAGALPDDYSEDVKSQFPADYKGFRQYFSYYALPHLFDGDFLLHQWHDRPLTRLYHRRRKDNELLFADILSHKKLPVRNGIVPFSDSTNLPDYREWIVKLMKHHKLDIQQYPGLFSWKEGVSRPSGGLRRKLRKLVLKPKQFFKDMV